MQQGIKKLQWFEYFKVVFLEILNAGLCRVFANQVTYDTTQLLTTTIPLPARHYTLLHFAATISYLSYILLWQVFGPTFEALLKSGLKVGHTC